MLSLFTASVLFCTIGEDPTFGSCHVLNSHVKYVDEDTCVNHVAEILNTMFETEVLNTYYVADIECQNWLDDRI